MPAVRHPLLSGLGGGAIERPVDRSAADVELVGDVLHGVAPAAVVVELVAHLACELHVRGLELGFAAAGAAASARGPQPVAGAFGEQIARSNTPTAPSTAKNIRPAAVDVSICC